MGLVGGNAPAMTQEHVQRGRAVPVSGRLFEEIKRSAVFAQDSAVAICGGISS